MLLVLKKFYELLNYLGNGPLRSLALEMIASHQPSDVWQCVIFLSFWYLTSVYSCCPPILLCFFAVFQWLSCVWFFVTPWTVAHQGPLSMEFFRQKYCSGLPFLSPGVPSWRKIESWCDLCLKTTELKKNLLIFKIFWFILKN